MARPTTRTRSAPAFAAAAAAVIAGGALWFAAPDRPVAPPLVDLPGAADVPAAAPARPDMRARAGACDGAEQATVRGPRPLAPPQSWFSSDDYPALALMAGHVGTAQTELVIDARGAVIGYGIAGSSGHGTLDRQTCAIFRRRARFAPAEDARGCPSPPSGPSGSGGFFPEPIRPTDQVH